MEATIEEFGRFAPPGISYRVRRQGVAERLNPDESVDQELQPDESLWTRDRARSAKEEERQGTDETSGDQSADPGEDDDKSRPRSAEKTEPVAGKLTDEDLQLLDEGARLRPSVTQQQTVVDDYLRGAESRALKEGLSGGADATVADDYLQGAESRALEEGLSSGADATVADDYLQGAESRALKEGLSGGADATVADDYLQGAESRALKEGLSGGADATVADDYLRGAESRALEEGLYGGIEATVADDYLQGPRAAPARPAP